MCFFFGSFEHLKHIDKRVCLKIDSKINQFLLIFRVKLVGHLLETHLTCIRFYYHQATLSKATVISIFRPRTRPLRRMYALVHRPYLEYRWVVGEVFFFFWGGGGGGWGLWISESWRQHFQVVVSSIVYFYPYLGKSSNLTNIFQTGWNQQLDLHKTWTKLLEISPANVLLRGGGCKMKRRACPIITSFFSGAKR